MKKRQESVDTSHTLKYRSLQLELLPNTKMGRDQAGRGIAGNQKMWLKG